MNFKRALVGAGLLVACAGASAAGESLRVLSATPAPALERLFQRTNGWLGADGDYSVAVTPERTLWFFSDTWIGQLAGGRRTNVVLVNNSVGAQTGRGAAAAVEFFWGREIKGQPAAFFVPEDGLGWFWPLGGVQDTGRVWVMLHQMEKSGEGGAFGFRNVAVWLGEVANPLETPGRWRVTQRKLPFTELSATRRALFGAAVLRHGEHIYIYGTEERPKERGFGRRMILARVEAGAIADFTRWRFFDDGAWREDFRRVSPLASGMASEYSVTWIEAIGQFLAVGHDVFLSPKIVARAAPQPWGPWSEPVPLYTCPEAGWSKQIFCYAGKAHAMLSSGDELVLSYAANSFSLAEVIHDARLYWPKFVRVRMTPAAIAR
jgi:hypothetical protein